MSLVAFELAETPMKKLKALSSEAGLDPAYLVRMNVEAWLNEPESEFQMAAAYVLKKNSELYRRLA